MLGNAIIAKCLLCGSDNVGETGDDDYPFACHDCGAWGEKIDDISNNPPEEDWNPTGQVPRRPTE